MATGRRSRRSVEKLLDRLDEILATSEETRLVVAEMLLKHERLRRDALAFQTELDRQQRNAVESERRANGKVRRPG